MTTLYTNGIFIGKVLAGQGQKKDGSAWTRYKLTFKPNETSDKTFSMTTFDSGLQLKELQWYNLEYVEKEGTYQGSPVTYKTLVQAKEGKGESSSAPQQKSMETPKSQPTATEDELKAFAQQYVVNMHNANKLSEMSENHFIGTWTRAKDKEGVKPLIDAFHKYALFGGKDKPTEMHV